MSRSQVWLAMATAFSLYFGAFGFFDVSLRREGQVHSVVDRQLVVVHDGKLKRAYEIEKTARINLNDGPASLHELAVGDDVAILTDLRGTVRDVLAARFAK